MLKKNPRDQRFPTEQHFEVEHTSANDAPEVESGSYSQPVRSRPSGEMGGRATAPQSAESVIDQHSSFDGRFETNHDLRVEGSISGEVVCRGRFTVEREANARARIEASDAHIKGRLDGDIVCSGQLVIASTAAVTGTIKAGTLVVEEGASLSGSVEAAKTTAAAAPLRPTAAEAAIAPAPAPARSTRTREVPSFALVPNEDKAGAN
jgi:cytoskeletal protein CcmA (bactofilin family)